MPADPFTLRQADQARTDFAIIEKFLRERLRLMVGLK
jgi:hypothetical protein